MLKMVENRIGLDMDMSSKLRVSRLAIASRHELPKATMLLNPDASTPALETGVAKRRDQSFLWRHSTLYAADVKLVCADTNSDWSVVGLPEQRRKMV